MEKSTNNVNKIIMQEYYDKKLQENIRNYSRTIEEKGHSAALTLLGRKAFFEEYFDGISLENQNIPSVGPFENPRITKSFQIGYERGAFLVKNGFDFNSYQKFLEELEQTKTAKKRR